MHCKLRVTQARIRTNNTRACRGEPDKQTDTEKIERTFLNLLNKLAKKLDGAGGRKVDFEASKEVLKSMEAEWAKWEAATA